MDPEHPSVLNTLESLAEACMDARRYPHALRYYEELLKRCQGSEPAGSTESILKQASILRTIGTIHMHQDDPQAQMKKLQMAIRLLRSDTTTAAMSNNNNTNGGTEQQKLIEERVALDKNIMGELELVQSELRRNSNSSDREWV
jgi:tetratricopeptide (TPR) repeat protein